MMKRLPMFGVLSSLVSFSNGGVSKDHSNSVNTGSIYPMNIFTLSINTTLSYRMDMAKIPFLRNIMCIITGQFLYFALTERHVKYE